MTRGPSADVELALRGGTLRCPPCGGVLRPWGTARARLIWTGRQSRLMVRPYRARCLGCRVTHVLLPDWMSLRRSYAAVIIRRALTAHAGGLGYRRIAQRLRVPATTVRDWLRAVMRNRLRVTGFSLPPDVNTSPPHAAPANPSAPVPGRVVHGVPPLSAQVHRTVD